MEPCRWRCIGARRPRQTSRICPCLPIYLPASTRFASRRRTSRITWELRRCRLRFGNRAPILAGALACGAILIRGQLDPWVQHIPAGPAIAALFESVPMPGGPTQILRPPGEARPALTSLITNAPRDAALYRLRAQEAEVALDFTAAEADWKACVPLASDRYSAQLDLADFYHRRARPRDELSALMAATGAKDDPLLPATSQRAWRAFV